MKPVAPLGAAVVAAVAFALAGCQRSAEPEAVTAAPAASVTATTFGVSKPSSGAVDGSPGSVESRSAPGGPAGHAAQVPPPPVPRASEADRVQASTDDLKFIADAQQAGRFEVQVSQLAAGLAGTPEVKALATLFVNDHTNANNELLQLAAARGVAVPVALPNDLQAQLRRWAQRSGEAFDRDYLQQVGIRDHRQAIEEFESASRRTEDPQLKEWIDKTLPALRQHLSEAQKLVEGQEARISKK